MEELHTGIDWASLLGDDIIDADGWNERVDGMNSRQSFYTREITKGDYQKRLSVSTVLSRKVPFCDYCHTRHFGYQDHQGA